MRDGLNTSIEIFRSSAKSLNETLLFMYSLMLFIDIRNRVTLSTDPWGTTFIIESCLDVVFPVLTEIFRLERKLERTKPR